MAPPEGWTTLGCSSARCCCCPNTVYYPPHMHVKVAIPLLTYSDDGSTITGASLSIAEFDISCVWLDCPLGTNRFGSKCCSNEPDDDTPCVEVSKVPRCHGCVYLLTDSEGHPFINPIGGTDYTNGVPLLVNDPQIGDPNHQITVYINDCHIICNCGFDLVTGTGPGIPTYIEPDSGDPCGWQGRLTAVKANGDPVIGLPLNLGTLFADYPNPPIQITAPLDPFSFSCCDPFHARFFVNNYEPFWYCGFYDGSYWPDISEWPPHPGQIIPWNFLIPCCNLDPSGNCCSPFVHGDCTCSDTPVGDPPATPMPCQVNPDPSLPFGYIDISGGASCFLPRSYVTNCLDAYTDGC